MGRIGVSTCLAAAVCGAIAWGGAARAADRTPEQILKEIEAVAMPKVPAPEQRNDRAVIAQYLEDQREAMVRRADLIGELYKLDPANEQLVKLLPVRWRSLQMAGPGKEGELAAELADVAAHSKTPALRTEAAYYRAVDAARMARGNPDAFINAAETFIKAAPKDERGGLLLYSAASMMGDTEKQAALYRRVIKDYPGSRPAKSAEGSLRKLDAVGKPFELAFTDAVTGTEVSMKALRGKVVVVDFWATWCGPCVAEMPKMKKLYAEYKDKGVEFIGVSLDQPREQGGLDRLKEFVAKNEITWPQYYQGNFWQSDFSSSWGINSIPCVFIVNADGNLHSVNARGKLETMIPELLKKRDDTKPDTGAGGS